MDKPRRIRTSPFQELIPTFIQLANSGLNGAQISRKLNVSAFVVQKHLKRNGILLNKEGYNRQYKIDGDAFKTLTKETVYWLGCLYGDGYIGKTCVSLVGHWDDMEHVLKFKRFLNSEHQIRKTNHANAYEFKFSHKGIRLRLGELGLYPNKTHTMTYPMWLPNGTHSHFIRGLFDTDGCFSISRKKAHYRWNGCFSITMNKFMVDKIASTIENELGLTPTTLAMSNSGGNTKKVSYEGNIKLSKIYQWLYKDAEDSIVMERKRNKFYECIKTYIQDG